MLAALIICYDSFAQIKGNKIKPISYLKNENINKRNASPIKGENILLKNVNDLSLKVKYATLLHHNGNIAESIKYLLEILSLPNAYQKESINDLVKGKMLLADCFYSFLQLEKYKKVVDEISTLCEDAKIENWIKTRALLYQIKYFNYHVQIDKARILIDSAYKMFNFLDPSDKEKNYVLLLTCQIQFRRNYDRKLLSPEVIKTFISKVDQISRGDLFEKIVFWRTLGNYYLDNCQDAKNWNENRKHPWYQKAMYCYGKATSIIESIFPNNDIEKLNLHNLRAILNYNHAYFLLVKKETNAATRILNLHDQEKKDFIPYFITTFSITEKLIDKIYSHTQLINEKGKMLKSFQDIERYWDEWELTNRRDTLLFSKDIYIKSCNNYIVSLAYDLYQLTKNKKYIQLAFEAQERGKYQALLNSFQRSYKDFGSENLEIEAIQNKLKFDEAYISFSFTKAQLNYQFIIVISKDSAGFIRINSFDSGLNINTSPEVNYSISGFNNFKRKYFNAYNLIFKPIKNIIGYKVSKLLVFPTDYSSFIKFDLLISDTTGYQSYKDLPYLLKSFGICYNYSYQIHSLQTKYHPVSNDINSQVYVPDYTHTDYADLLFFKRDSKQFEQSFRTNFFMNHTSTISRFITNVPSADIITIAAHSSINERSSDFNGIVMDADKSLNTNILSPHTIVNSPLNASLTVLALCESGIGDMDVTNANLNLAYWFSYAGSKACLYSYWKLDDKSTSIILQKFMHHLSKGKNKSVALSLAKAEYIYESKSEEELNPIYWGGLEVIGDDSPIVPNRNNYSISIFVAGILIVLVIIFLFK